MACSSVQCQSTKETTNACRVLHLLFGPCTDQFRDLLTHHFTPGALYGRIQQEKALAKTDSFLKKISSPQKFLLFPSSGSYISNYTDFDINLIYTLLRNLSGLPSHINGWGKVPDPSDFSEAANIERVRILRNRFVHSQSIALSDADFQNVWANTKQVVQNLDLVLANGGKYENAMVYSEHMTMDVKETEFWKNELKRKYEEDMVCKEEIKKVKEELGKVKTTVEEIQATAHIPNNIRKLHEKILEAWRKSDERYVEPHFFHELMAIIKKNNIIILTGGPGCGKTSTSCHVAIKFLELEFSVLPIDTPNDIKRYGDPNFKQVFVLDNAFGDICFDQQLYNKFRKKFDVIQQMLEPNSKLLITCRKTILMEARQLKARSSLPQTVFDLEDGKHVLTREDKESIISKYVDLDNSPVAQEIKEYVRESAVLPMFPLLCKMFSSNMEYQNKGCSFFKEPYPIIFEQLEEMESEKRLSYAALVLCMLNEGHFSKSILQNDALLKDKIYEYCKVKYDTANWEIIDSISQMVGTYVKECDGEFTFLHDLMFEVVACHFGQKCPQEIINRLSSEFISRRLTLEDIQEDRLRIHIPDSEYKALAERLHRDLKDLRLYNVFASEFLHNAKVCDHFLSILDNDSGVEISVMFLSPNSNFKDFKSVSILFDQKLDVRKFFTLFLPNLIEDPQSIERTEPSIGIDELGIPDNFNIYFIPINCQIRLISWVIAYGHEKILRYIIEKMYSQNKDMGMVFGTDVESQTRYIFLACHSKNANVLELVLKHVDPECKNACLNLNEEEYSDNGPFYKNFTPLTFSVLQESADIVDSLLKAGADINASDAHCWSPLNCAIARSKMNLIEKLVAAGADVNKCGNVESPLIYASKSNNTEAVEFLLRSGAHVNVRTEDGVTALYYASDWGNIEMLNTLFEYGADYSLQKDNESSPFCIAAANGHLPVLEVLSEHGADCKYVDENGSSPLSLASAGGFQDVVKYLIEKGADCNSYDILNCTALIAAIENKHPNIACLLIDHGANVNIVYKNDNSSALHVAVKLNDTQTISALIKKFPNYRLMNSENMTPLEMSVWMGRTEITTSLVKGENLCGQGRGNIHLFDIVTKIRSSVLFFNTKDEIEARDAYQCIKNDERGSEDACEAVENDERGAQDPSQVLENDKSERQDALNQFSKEEMKVPETFRTFIEEKLEKKNANQPLYCKAGSLIERILKQDEYDSLRFLLELGLRGDRLIMNSFKKQFWWQVNNNGSMLPIKCVCHYIIQMSVENRNMQSLKLIVDYKFQKEAYTEYIRQPFIFATKHIFRNLDPYCFLSFHDQMRDKLLEYPESINIQNDSFNKYFMDNSISILHLLSKRLTELEFWKDVDDTFCYFFLNSNEEDAEKEFINKAFLYLRSRMRRHSV